MLKDPSVTGRGWAVTQVTRGRNQRQGGRFFGYSLRTPRWRYTEWAEGKQGRELYDHDADPRELTNLADDPGQTRTVARLSRQLHEAIRETFPASGKTPELRPGLWAPNLTNP
jgi:iduronate 2-sulfatase